MTIIEALQKAILEPRSLTEEEIQYSIPGSDDYLRAWLKSAIENWPALTEEEQLRAGQNLNLILQSNLKLHGQSLSDSQLGNKEIGELLNLPQGEMDNAL